MKVSRKVGRRSHSSVSRRRLRNKKTKSGSKKRYTHTQRRGVRSRRYKRGRRFHVGGVDRILPKFITDNPKLYKKLEGSFEIEYDGNTRVFDVVINTDSQSEPRPDLMLYQHDGKNNDRYNKVFYMNNEHPNRYDILISSTPNNVEVIGNTMTPKSSLFGFGSGSNDYEYKESSDRSVFHVNETNTKSFNNIVKSVLVPANYT